MRRILIVCAGNTCRSPMAAALAQHLLGTEVQVESAGFAADAGSAATRYAVQVMNERGLDISRHKARHLSEIKLSDYHLLIALEPSIARRFSRQQIDDSKIRFIDVSDPYNKGIEAYRCAAEVSERELRQIFDVT
jgi:protein-tyrosine-phosphatase